MVRHSRGKYAGSVADFNEALLLDPNDKHAKKLREHSADKEREVLLTTITYAAFVWFVVGSQIRHLAFAQPCLQVICVFIVYWNRSRISSVSLLTTRLSGRMTIVLELLTLASAFSIVRKTSP